MMKRIYFLIAGLILFGTAMAQTKEGGVKTTPLYKHYQMKYVHAMKYNDWRTAVGALYDIVVLDPADDSVKLNLSYLYFDNGVFPSALFVANDVLARNSQNEDALNISAACYENMGLKAKAIENYETIYLNNNDINVLFRIAALQYELGRMAEAKNNAKIISTSSRAKEVKLTFPTSDEKQQEIPLTAAALNLMGVIEKDQGNTAQAREHFNQALAIAPDFDLVKQGLKELE